MEIKFKIYPKEYYDKIFTEIYQIDKSWDPKTINKFIQERISLTTLFGLPLNEQAWKTFPIYRGRAINVERGDTIDENEISSFSYPPVEFITKHGRANRIGQQVFYASGDPHTTFHELGKDITPNSTLFYLSKWGLMGEWPGKVIMRNLFFGIPVDTEHYASIMAGGIQEKFDEMFAKHSSQAKKQYCYGQLKYAELFTNPSEEYYHITSSIAHDTFVDALNQGVSMPIITYPSVAKQRESVNFAFRKDFVDKYFYLQHVHKVLVTGLSKEQVNISLVSVGVPENGKMRWIKPRIFLDKIDYSKTIIFTEKHPDGRQLENGEEITVCCEKHKMTVTEFMEKSKVDPLKLLGEIAQMPLKMAYDKLPTSFDTALEALTEGKLYVHNKIVEEGIISKIKIPIKCQISYF